MPIRRSMVQCTTPLVIHSMQIRLILQQQLHRLDMSIQSCVVKRSPVLCVYGIDRSSLTEERNAHLTRV